MNNQYYIDIIRPKLTEKRFHHSMCVAGMAGKLAEKYGADPEKAYVAGILHDIMKDTPKDEQLKIIENSDILLDNVEKSQFKLLHAIAGYAYIRDVLKIDDEEILNGSQVSYDRAGVDDADGKDPLCCGLYLRRQGFRRRGKAQKACVAKPRQRYA